MDDEEPDREVDASLAGVGVGPSISCWGSSGTFRP